MDLIHSFWLAAVSVAVTMATLPAGSPPMSFAIASTRASPICSEVAWLTKKSRESGWPSASQVSTWTPLAWASFMAGARTLGSLGETAMASAPFSVQVSISDAAFSGRAVGRAVVDQIHVAQVFGRLLRAVVAGGEVGQAFLLGQQVDGDLLAAVREPD